MFYFLKKKRKSSYHIKNLQAKYEGESFSLSHPDGDVFDRRSKRRIFGYRLQRNLHRLFDLYGVDPGVKSLISLQWYKII